jgi:hypothetical protein
VAVAVRILDKVVLMVLFCRVETLQREGFYLKGCSIL